MSQTTLLRRIIMATKSWTYRGWVCSGEESSDGSMRDANVYDNSGLMRDRWRNFGSVQDFKDYVDSNM